ncbi:MAG: hypothetical protein V4692_13290, partial [Bdellovibrionota bacterium]
MIAMILHPVRNVRDVNVSISEFALVSNDVSSESSGREPASSLKTNRKKPTQYFFKIRSHAEFMKLSKKSRQVYVREIRAMIVEVSKQLESETEFELASKNALLQKLKFLFGGSSAQALTEVVDPDAVGVTGPPKAAAPAGRTVEAKVTASSEPAVSISAAVSGTVPDAPAPPPSATESIPTPEAAGAGSGRSCIYAGWVLQYEGRYCARPPRGSCLAGQVQCNAEVFGAGKCAPIGRTATAHCARNAAPLSEIVAHIEKNREAWDKLKTDLDSYCPSERQRGICRTIQSRIAALEPAVSALPAVAVADTGAVVSAVIRNPVAAASEMAGAEAKIAAPPITETIDIPDRQAPAAASSHVTPSELAL